MSFLRGQELALTGARCRVSSPHPPHPIESDSNMDKASQALAESLPDGIPDTLTARAAHSNVPLSTVTHRANGRPSKEAKAVGQRYLYPYEEDAVVDFVLQSSALGFPIRMKYLLSLHVWRKTLRGDMQVTLPTTTKPTAAAGPRKSRIRDLNPQAFSAPRLVVN
jgi:hypothetical protein